MSDHDPDPGHGPGDRPGDRGVRRLERAPGERYRDASGDGARASRSAAGVTVPPGRSGSLVRALVAADVVAGAGSLVIVALGLADLGPAMLAAGAAIGWGVALALIWGWSGPGMPGRRARITLAGGLAALGVVVGLLLEWAWGRAQGGTLDPIAYVDARFGLLAWAAVVLAAATGALRAR